MSHNRFARRRAMKKKEQGLARHSQPPPARSQTLAREDRAVHPWAEAFAASSKAAMDFFSAHPDRKHRLRAPMPYELAMYARAIGLPAVPETLARAVIAVAKQPVGVLWHPVYYPGFVQSLARLDCESTAARLFKNILNGRLDTEDSAALHADLVAAGVATC